MTKLLQRILALTSSVMAAGLTLWPTKSAAQVDFRNVRRGIHVHRWDSTTSSQLASIRAQGYDHIRIVPRAHAAYGGGRSIPDIRFTQDQLNKMGRLFRAAKAEGLRLIISPETYGDEYSKTFKDFTRSRGGNWGARLDPFLDQIAHLVAGFDSRWIMVEPYNELGWFVRDTDTYNRGLGHGRLDHPRARKLATEAIERLLDRFVPAFRAVAPNVTLLLPGPGFGQPIGPGEWNDLDLRKWDNVRYRIHFYGPRELTHNGRNGAAMKPYQWPDPTGEWREHVNDLRISRYEFGNLPWTKDSIRKILKPVVDHFRAQGIGVIMTEFGSIAASRNNPANRAYLRDVIEVADELGIPWTEWRGEHPF